MSGDYIYLLMLIQAGFTKGGTNYPCENSKDGSQSPTECFDGKVIQIVSAIYGRSGGGWNICGTFLPCSSRNGCKIYLSI